jgi:hypothetical protein
MRGTGVGSGQSPDPSRPGLAAAGITSDTPADMPPMSSPVFGECGSYLERIGAHWLRGGARHASG